MTLLERLEKADLTPMERRIGERLTDLPVGCSQRIDGLRCEPALIADSDSWAFWWALWRMRRRGLVRRTYRPNHTIWWSCKDMPFYEATPALFRALEQTP